MNKAMLIERWRWNTVMWCVGVLNVIAFLPQLWQVWDTHKVNGVSIAMFSLFGLIQIGYATNGWLRGDRGTMWGMICSFILSMSIIGSVLYFR